jgi:ABC-type phosphate transport system ATPase subunit
LNQQDFRTMSVLQTPSISHINFRLTDQNDNLLDLNDINYEFSIQFMIFNRPISERQQPEQRRQIPIIQQQPNPQPMVESNNIEIVDELTADDTHPIQGKTHIEHVAEKTILDNIIDNL